MSNELLDRYFRSKYKITTSELITLGNELGNDYVYNTLKMIDDNRINFVYLSNDVKIYGIDSFDELMFDQMIRAISFMYKFDDHLMDEEFDPDELELEFKFSPYVASNDIHLRKINESLESVFIQIAEQAGFNVTYKEIEFAD